MSVDCLAQSSESNADSIVVRIGPCVTPVTEYVVGATFFPDDVEYIIVYSQYKKVRRINSVGDIVGRASVLFPYVIRFEDNTGLSIQRKQARKVLRQIKRRPISIIRFEGFELDHIGNMQDDIVAQRASETVANYGLHDYGNRTTPVYYFSRIH